MHDICTLLSGVEATGTSGPLRTDTENEDHTIQGVFTNSGGSVTALVVDIEGSLDGANWHQLAQHTFTGGELTAKAAMWHITNRRVKWIRANITTLTETGTTAVYVYYLG